MKFSTSSPFFQPVLKLSSLLFAQADRGGGDFQIFVLAHHLEPALDGELVGWHQVHCFVAAGGAHVGQLFAFGRIDEHLLALGSVTDDLPLIHFGRRFDIEYAAVLQVPQREAEHLAGCHRYHRADGAFCNFSRVRTELDEARGKDALAARVEHKLRAVAEQAARRALHNKAHVRVGRAHVFDNHFALAEALDDGSLIDCGDVDDNFLERLHFDAILLVEDNLRLGNLQLKPLAAHVLKQYRDVELAASVHFKIFAGRKIDFEPDVYLELLFQTRAYLPAGDKLALAAGERRVVDQKIEADGRLINRDGRERLGVLLRANCFADVDVRQAGHQYDVAGGRILHLHAVKTFKRKHFKHALRARWRVEVLYKHIRSRFKDAVINSHHREPAQKVVISEVKRLRAQRLGALLHRRRGRHMLEYRVQQRGEVSRLIGELFLGYPLPADRVDHGEVALLVVGAELQKELKHALLCHSRVGGGFIDFIYHDDRLQSEFERF